MMKDEGLVQCVTYEEYDHEPNHDQLIAATSEAREVSIAMDSGSVENVIHPAELPADTPIEPNHDNMHFVGANTSRIENYGTCMTSLNGEGVKCDAQCSWTTVQVARPLHVVCKFTGKPESPKQDVLFNSRKCVVVPPGVVDKIPEHITPALEYGREGGLYTAEMEQFQSTTQGFGRQGMTASNRGNSPCAATP